MDILDNFFIEWSSAVKTLITYGKVVNIASLTANPNQLEIKAGETASATVTATTSNSEAVSLLEIYDNPEWVTLDNDIINFAPPSNIEGQYSFSIRAKSSTDKYKTIIFPIKVSPSLTKKGIAACSVSEMLEIIRAGKHTEWWSVGDRTGSVSLSGSVDGISLSSFSVNFRIIGFDHNKSREHPSVTHSVTFMCCVGNTNIAFNDLYASKSSTNSGGWRSCSLRNTACANFYNCLPTDYKNAIISLNKYTDNVANGTGNSSNMSATSDKVFVPSMYEICGSVGDANTSESSYCQKYSYFTSSNRVCYRHDKTGATVAYWTRSPSANSRRAKYWTALSIAGAQATALLTATRAFFPCFAIG